jgi:hypothetical protein
VDYKQAARLPRLTQHQKAVLQVLSRWPTVTIASAGVAIHMIDSEKCRGITGLPESQRQPCCEPARDRAYAVCRQLANRGILESVGRGVWALGDR